jgi:hypothetical protein
VWLVGANAVSTPETTEIWGKIVAGGNRLQHVRGCVTAQPTVPAGRRQ